MNKSKKAVLGFVLLALIAIVCYFVWDKQDRNTSEGTTTVNVGAILPLTGQAAGVGKSAREGLLLAEQYINDQVLRGEKYKLHFVIEDGEGRPAKSLSALNKLLSREHCNVILSMISPVDLSILPVQKQKHFLFVSHASHPELSGVNNLVFRHSQVVSQEFSLFEKAIDADWGHCAYVYINDDYGVALSNLIKAKHGVADLNEYPINSSEGVNKTAIDKVLKGSPKYIILNGSAPLLTQVINTLAENGYQGKVYTSLGFVATGGDVSLKGLTGYVDFDLNLSLTELSQRLGSIGAGESYNPTHLVFLNTALWIADAVKSGKTTPEGIAQYIRDKKTFSGIGEEITLNQDNDMLLPVVMRKSPNSEAK